MVLDAGLLHDATLRYRKNVIQSESSCARDSSAVT